MAAQDVFQEGEAKDGFRFSWNVLPSNSQASSSLSVPVAALYTPMRSIDNLFTANYTPVVCQRNGVGCKAVLNPYCRVDFANKLWMCPFCMQRNEFPASYASISQESRPAEIMPQYTTMEYVLDATPKPPTFVFVIDTCNFEDEVDALKDAIIQNLMLLPANAQVGLIAYDRNVQVYEVGYEACPKAHTFNGAKSYTSTDVARLLSLPTGKTQDGKQATTSSTSSSFIVPVSECESMVTAILEDITKESWPTASSHRAISCSGSALNLALGLIEATQKDGHGRIMMFMGSPATLGPGKIVDSELKASIRSHHDISKGKATHYKEAYEFYTGLAARARAVHTIVDVFACSLDQLGLAEMRVLVEGTGGNLVLDDSFTKQVFTGSFKGMFAKMESKGQQTSDLAMAFFGNVQVMTSREMKICGAIGNLTSLDKKSDCVSQNKVVGVGKTSAWSLGGMDPNTTVAIYFDMAAKNAQELRGARQGYIQVITTYRHSNGSTRLRVSTVAKAFADASPEGLNYIRAGFDQEAAAVIMARYAVYRTQTENLFDIRNWLDRSLINLCKKFATYQPNQPSTFRMAPEMSFYPMFMFHLRRSQFLQIFNCTPDETTFYRILLLRENVSNSIVMIQPSLVAYSLDGPAQAVTLDMASATPNRILFLDTFFSVIIWYGDNIAKWQAQGVHLQPNYEYFAHLLKAPKNDAQQLIKTRFPYPMLVECVEGGSQERFLLAKLNPSAPPSNSQGAPQARKQHFSEDVSFTVFMDHLRKLSVQV